MRRPRFLEQANSFGFVLRCFMTVLGGVAVYLVGMLLYALCLGIYWYPKVFGIIGGAIIAILLVALVSYTWSPKDD